MITSPGGRPRTRAVAARVSPSEPMDAQPERPAAASASSVPLPIPLLSPLKPLWCPVIVIPFPVFLYAHDAWALLRFHETSHSLKDLAPEAKGSEAGYPDKMRRDFLTPSGAAHG